jgi:hypothetical protein
MKRDRRQQLVKLFRLQQRLRRGRRWLLGHGAERDVAKQDNDDQSREPGHRSRLLIAPRDDFAVLPSFSQVC